MGYKSKVLIFLTLIILIDILIVIFYFKYIEKYLNDKTKTLQFATRIHFVKPRISQVVSSKPCQGNEKQSIYESKERISEKKCSEYVWKRNQLQKCGKFRQKHVFGIIGGYAAMTGEFPHMAAMGWRTLYGGWSFKCGASLISPKFLVTAAHCTKCKPDRDLMDTVPEIVRLGVVNIMSSSSNHPVDVNISRMIQHPNYKSPRKYYDIALVELLEEVEFGATIQPACLWSKASTRKIGRRVVTSGWGITNVDTKRPSSVLRAVDLFVINSGMCKHLLKPYSIRHWSVLADHQLCAGELAGGLDACQGDSGGPLQVEMSHQHKMYYLIGVTSFGYGCGLRNVPGLYTRVASFIDWIEENVWKDEIKPKRNTSNYNSPTKL